MLASALSILQTLRLTRRHRNSPERTAARMARSEIPLFWDNCWQVKSVILHRLCAAVDAVSIGSWFILLGCQRSEGSL